MAFRMAQPFSLLWEQLLNWHCCDNSLISANVSSMPVSMDRLPNSRIPGVSINMAPLSNFMTPYADGSSTCFTQTAPSIFTSNVKFALNKVSANAITHGPSKDSLAHCMAWAVPKASS